MNERTVRNKLRREHTEMYEQARLHAVRLMHTGANDADVFDAIAFDATTANTILHCAQLLGVPLEATPIDPYTVMVWRISVLNGRRKV